MILSFLRKQESSRKRFLDPRFRGDDILKGIMDFKKVLNSIKDYLFPVFCLGCGKEEVWVCEECFKQIDAKGVFSCKNGYLDSVQSIVAYEEEGLIGKIIRGFKYNYAEELKSVIEKIIKIFLLSHEGIFSGLKAIVPIPLHPRRYAERGFNQAEVIAKILSAEMNIPCQVLLKRQKYTKQQAKLNREERKINVDKAFSVLEKPPETVLLVDDVFTTGATMQEGARVLKSAGAEKVIGFTLARG